VSSIKALTVQQPWASLIACGRKTLECRSRPLSYRGPLLIHAGLRVQGGAAEALDLCRAQGEADDVPQILPVGALVALVEVTGCRRWADDLPGLLRDLDAQEGRLYELPETLDEAREAVARKGEWLWELRLVRAISPVYCKGAQGIWSAEVTL